MKLSPSTAAWIIGAAVRFDAVLVWVRAGDRDQALLMPRSLWRKARA